MSRIFQVDSSLLKILFLLIGMLGLFAIFLTFLYPFHLPPWVTFYNEWLFAIFLGLAVAWVFANGRVNLGSPYIFLFLLFMVFHVLVLVRASRPEETDRVLYLIYLGLAYIAYLAGLNFQSRWWLDAVLSVIVIAALISAVVAVVQWSGVVSGADWDPGFILYSTGGGRVASNIGQANNLGTLLVLGLGVVGYASNRLTPIHWVVHVGMTLIVFVLVLGVYLSGSRTAMLNLMLWPVLIFIWAHRQSRNVPLFAVVPILLLGALYVVMPPLTEWMGWFPAQEARSLVSDGSRVRLWSMVWEAIMESPWSGHGFGAVANSHLRLSPEYGSIDYSIANHAHNTVLDMWVIFGLPIGTLIVVGVLWLWGHAWHAAKESKDQFLWLMTTAMLVHALLEYPLHYGFFLWLLFFLFGVLAGKPWRIIRLKKPLHVALGWLALYLVLALSVWSAYVKLERNYTLYRQQGADITQVAVAVGDFPLQNTLFAEPYERLRWLTMPMDKVLKLSDADVLALEGQASYYPLPGLGWRMAFAQAARGNVEQATWWAERMCSMFDPRVCASAAEEWKRRGAENPKWPALPWEKWLPKSSAAH